MNAPPNHPLEAILRFCAETAPQPWYPSDFARDHGINRDSLDPHLDQLRLGVLISITDWQQGSGQGYALTPAGREALENPKHLAQLHAGALPASADGRVAGPASGDGMTSWNRGEIVRSAVYERGRPVVMQLLLGANIAVFLAGLYLTKVAHVPEEEALHRTGAVFVSDIVKGDWFRLFTCCFVHGNWIHLAMNMYALYVAGQVSEAMWGRARFLALYLIAGFGSSCVALAYQPVGLVGASGALCGVLAGEGVWIMLNRRHLDRRLVSSWLQNLLINAILIGVIGATVPRVSNSAHLGGAIIGAVAGACLNYQRFGQAWQRWLGLAGVLIVPLVCLGLLVRAKTVDPRWQAIAHQEEDGEFEKHFSKARDGEKAARAAYRDANLLRQEAPAQRDAAKTQETIEALTRVQKGLTDVATGLRTTRPFVSVSLETRRQVLQEYMDAWAKLSELAARCLEKGTDCTEADLEAWKEQEQKMNEVGERWTAIGD